MSFKEQWQIALDYTIGYSVFTLQSAPQAEPLFGRVVSLGVALHLRPPASRAGKPCPCGPPPAQRFVCMKRPCLRVDFGTWYATSPPRSEPREECVLLPGRVVLEELPHFVPESGAVVVALSTASLLVDEAEVPVQVRHGRRVEVCKTRGDAAEEVEALFDV